MIKLEWWQIAAALFGTGGATSLVTHVIALFRQRSRDNVIARGAVEKAARDLVEQALEVSTRQIDRMEKEGDRQRTQIDGLYTDMTELRAKHLECEENTLRLSAEIERLLAERETQPLPYRPEDLRRVGPPRPRRD